MSRLSRAPSSRGSDNAGLAKHEGEEKIVPRFANAEDPNAEEVGDDEIFEFLEGLIEGFRAAAQAAAAESLKPKEEELPEPLKEVPKPKPEAQKTNVKELVKRGGARGLGAWAELDALGKANQSKAATKKATIIPEAEEDEEADAQALSPAQRTSGGSGGYARDSRAAFSPTQRTSGGSGGYAAQALGSQASPNRPSSARQSDQQSRQGSGPHLGNARQSERQYKQSSGPLLGSAARQLERLEEAPLQRADSPTASSKRSQASGVAAVKGAMGSMASRTQSSYVGSNSENRTSSGASAIMSGPIDSVSSLMRLHALRSFFEETCGTVANAFDLMASTALRAQGGSGGSAEDRLSYLFQEDEFRNILAGMGYGVDATAAWWKGLFLNIDADRDGKISLQDMYDTMVLDLPIMDGDDTNVFFAGR